MSWTVFLSAFIFIFTAALPGRTTFLVLLLSSRGRPVTVFSGAALAFAIQAAISIALGHFLTFIPAQWVHLGAGLLFLYFAFQFWRESRHELSAPKERQSLFSVFLLVFVAELGDVSQLAIASVSSRFDETLIVFISAVAALWMITGLAILLGGYLSKWANPQLIQKIAAVGFAIVGLYLVISPAFSTVG